MGASKVATGKTIAASVTNVGAQEAGSKAKKTARPCINRQLLNTKMCVYYMKGACTYGDACTFAHSSSSLQAEPDLQKTRLCKAFTQGSCNDADCRFAHGEDELRSTGNFFKKTLCIWFDKGKCRHGQQCRFAHGLAELRMHESKAKAPIAPGTALTTPKAETAHADNGVARPAVQPAAPEVENIVPGPRVNRREPMKVNPPSFNSWPIMPTLEYPNSLYTNYMLENMMRQYHSFAQEVEQAENNRALAEELGRLHEHIRALSLQCNMLQQQMQETDGFSPSTSSTVAASDFTRGTSSGSSDTGSSRSRSQDLMEPLSPPPGLIDQLARSA